jgi:hypothetical protein
MCDPVAGQRDLPGGGRAAGGLGGCDGEDGDGEHGQGDPPVPGGPGGGLVLVQAGQALASLEILLDGPAAAGDADQGGQRDRLRGVAAVAGQFPAARVAADQQAPVSRAVVVDDDPCPVIPAVSLGALACG